MERLGNNKIEHQRADKNITLILNPIPAWKKKHNQIAKEISERLAG